MADNKRHSSIKDRQKYQPRIKRKNNEEPVLCLPNAVQQNLGSNLTEPIESQTIQGNLKQPTNYVQLNNRIHPSPRQLRKRKR